MKNKPSLAVDIGGLKMKNPVMTASGTFGFGKEYAPYLDLNRLGAIVVKGTTLKPKAGNKVPRIAETPAGMLNAVGLENPGVDYFLDHEMPFLKQHDVPVVVNIAGNSAADYAELAARLDREEGIAALEVNISCPNVKQGGIAFGTKCSMAQDVIGAVRKATQLPLIAKLSPNVTSIVEIAKSVEEAGADAVSLINTLLGMSIDAKTRKPRLANIVGGLSGPAVKPVALRMVWQVAGAIDIPIIGMGGIMTAEDAVEFLVAGASAVAVGTANFVNPHATMDIVNGIEQYLEEEDMQDIHELIGSLQI